MKDIKKVGDNACAMLAREATARYVAPEFCENKFAKIVETAAAENVSGKPLDLLKAFSDCVFSGTTPPPNILIFVAEKLALYFDKAGEMSLDESFDLKSKQSVGHPLKQDYEKKKRGPALAYMWQLRKQATCEKKVLSIENAAGLAITDLELDVSEDSLKKSYINNRVDEVLDNASDVISELQSAVK